MPIYLMLGSATLIVLALLVWLTMRRRQHVRTSGMLLRLLDMADQLELDLNDCRIGLQQAHAVMSTNPLQPALSEQEAHQAINSGLRALLQQRLWIRECSKNVDHRAYDESLDSMQAARERLRPLQLALSEAQSDLDSAMREHIPREP